MRHERAPCPNHPDEPAPRLGYLEACADADRRIKHKERQWKCGKCGLWVWEEYMTNFDGAEREDFYTRRMKREERQRAAELKESHP